MALLPYSCKMSKVSKKFGRRMRELRLDRDLSQLGLGELAGLDVTTINEVENGHREPMLGTIKKIAKALGVNLDKLIV